MVATSFSNSNAAGLGRKEHLRPPKFFQCLLWRPCILNTLCADWNMHRIATCLARQKESQSHYHRKTPRPLKQSRGSLVRLGWRGRGYRLTGFFALSPKVPPATKARGWLERSWSHAGNLGSPRVWSRTTERTPTARTEKQPRNGQETPRTNQAFSGSAFCLRT